MPPDFMQSLFTNQTNGMMNPFLASMAANPSATNTGAANPTMMNPLMSLFGQTMNNPMADMMRHIQPASTTSSEPPMDPPEVRFASQLQSMSDMGFTDQQKNIRALLASVKYYNDS